MTYYGHPKCYVIRRKEQVDPQTEMPDDLKIVRHLFCLNV